MKTYTFCHKYTSCVFYCSADCEKNAWEILTDNVKDPGGWRLEESEVE